MEGSVVSSLLPPLSHPLCLLHVQPCRIKELQPLVGTGTPPLNFDLSGNVQAQ